MYLFVEGAKEGLFKERLTALVAYMKAVDHVSFSTIRKFILDVLGKEFNGVLGCDYFSAYHKYMKDFSITVQFCIAHSSPRPASAPPTIWPSKRCALW